MLDLDLLLHNRLFAAANTAALLNYMALYAISSAHRHLPGGRAGPLGPGGTGWLLLGAPVMQAVLSPFAGTPERPHRLASAEHERNGAGRNRHGDARSHAGRRGDVARVVVEPGRGRRRVLPPSVLRTPPPSWAACGATSSVSRVGFSATMRAVGLALSVAVLGGIAASQLGRLLGGRLLYTHGHGAGALAASAVATSLTATRWPCTRAPASPCSARRCRSHGALARRRRLPRRPTSIDPALIRLAAGCLGAT